MKNKTEIQKEIDFLQKAKDDLTSRRDVLRADRENILAGKEEKARLVSEALLDGRDASQESTALEHDKAKLIALDDALALAESRHSEFSQKQANLQKALVMVDWERLDEEADKLLQTCISKFQAAIDANRILGEKLAELAQIAGPAGQSVDHNDRLKVVRDLNQFFGESSTNIVNKLKTMETSGAARFLESLRKKTK